MAFCTNQWTDLFVIGTSIMKELTTLSDKSRADLEILKVSNGLIKGKNNIRN